jgi:thiazole synthase|uniref:Thiamine biosynthesis protein G n=1 Tax=Lietzensia polymorpha TaxID=2962110 RepID=UPI00218204BA|nr:Thiamine biosynthesis protein G [Lietzensia polymorpha]YP_010479014.1 Thiamine biosynthesis protein G [Lietzensia polymorpha]UVI61253.1 Thiamine biosynthesis protein G [Lietzensia polymorpha]UVI61319.1 Thiamine biosynthesis protein G [Lietzensia polymorpha]
MVNFTDKWEVDNICFTSRLLVGTGRFENLEKTKRSIEISEPSLVTVAVRRLDIPKDGGGGLLNTVDWKRIWMLPNTAGSKTPDEAIRLGFLGREIAQSLGQEENRFLKLEVIADDKYLMPDPLGTIKAADYLIKKGFRIFPYINSDPILATHLEELGCATIMPLGSAIGSNQGLKNLENLKIIIEQAKLPVIIDAGIGRPSDASKAMEIGADAVLINTAIAASERPELMAQAMKYAVLAGRLGFLSNPQYKPLKKGELSSPSKGIPF